MAHRSVVHNPRKTGGSVIGMPMSNDLRGTGNNSASLFSTKKKTPRAQSLSKSVFGAIGLGGDNFFNNKRNDDKSSTGSRRASIAQIQVVNALEGVLGDENEFNQLFKNNLQNGMVNDT